MSRLWEDRYPGVDIVLIEPPHEDEEMFETSPISYSSRGEIAWCGFRSVADALGRRGRARARRLRAPRGRDRPCAVRDALERRRRAGGLAQRAAPAAAPETLVQEPAQA